MIMRFMSEDTYSATRLSFVCPACGQWGTFGPLGNFSDAAGVDKTKTNGGSAYIGLRLCPNPNCRAIIFVLHAEENVLTTYPPIRIDFDSTNIPSNILTVFEEALTCHANQAYIAAAIMVRRTLEEMCKDRNAIGSNLKLRIEDLKGKIIIPKDLIDGLDELRLLGNDAAHIEAQTYSQIDKEEIELAIAITKEILKALYQYDSLVNKLRARKQSNNSQ